MKDLILLDCEQGSEQWHNARLGIPTASQFKRIITTSGKPSAQAQSYLCELLAAQYAPPDTYTNTDMQRGVELEPRAKAAFEFFNETEIINVGGIYLDQSKRIMCSPDGLIPTQRTGIEIKCPRISTHISYTLNNSAPSAYTQQIQGGLWITGYDKWLFISYCPEYTPQPLLILTVERDEALIKQMDKHIRAFSKSLEAHKAETGVIA